MSVWKAVGGLWSVSRHTTCCIVQRLVFLNLDNRVDIILKVTTEPFVEIVAGRKKSVH